MSETSRPGIRWWPAVVILVLAAVALAVWVVFAGEVDGQGRTMRAGAIGLLAGFLLLLWLLFASRARWPHRLAALALVGLLGVVASQLLEVRGVTGDLVPIVAFKQTEPNLERPAAPAAMVVNPERPAELAPVAEPPTAATAGEPVSPSTEAARVADTVAVEVVAPVVVSPTRLSGDFPQFLGPTRDGRVVGVRLARDWKTRPPRELWRRQVGAAWSGFAVADDLAVTQEQDGESERITAYDLTSGALRWSHASPGRYATTIAGVGPRATPTIDGDQVFAVGAVGRVTALDRTTGRLLWQRDLGVDAGAPALEWGRSTSPLVVGELVVVNGGGVDRSLVAYDRRTGEVRWAAGTDGPSYSSPVRLVLGGVEQIVVFGARRVSGHDLSTGAELWTHTFPGEQSNVAIPLLLPEDHVLVSAGYGAGSGLFKVRRGDDGTWSASSVWHSPRLKSKFSNPVVHGGRVFGLDDGTLACLEPATGDRCFREGRYGHGQVLLVDDLLLVTTESGELVLVEPNPAGPKELARLAVLEGKSWNPPALAGRYLLVRNDREAVCLEMAVEE